MHMHVYIWRPEVNWVFFLNSTLSLGFETGSVPKPEAHRFSQAYQPMNFKNASVFWDYKCVSHIEPMNTF